MTTIITIYTYKRIVERDPHYFDYIHRLIDVPPISGNYTGDGGRCYLLPAGFRIEEDYWYGYLIRDRRDHKCALYESPYGTGDIVMLLDSYGHPRFLIPMEDEWECRHN